MINASLISARQINRQALGAIVFGDLEQRRELERIVWPEIHSLAVESLQAGVRENPSASEWTPCLTGLFLLRETCENSCRSRRSSHLTRSRYVPRDLSSLQHPHHDGSAILGWNAEVDSVWVTWVPREEAVRRIMERNGLSREDAETRINSQVVSYSSLLFNLQNFSLYSQMEIEKRKSFGHVLIDTSGPKEVTKAKLNHEWDILLHHLSSSSVSFAAAD